MDKQAQFLKEWVVNYVKNKDLFLKSILDIKEEGQNVFVKYKTKEVKFLTQPKINSPEDITSKIDEEKYYTICCFNTKASFNILVSNWKKLSTYKGLSILFINPFSNSDKKWIISPHTHNKISDDASLKMGLKSMFDTVEEFSERDFSKID